jgi:hypothetical protein
MEMVAVLICEKWFGGYEKRSKKTVKDHKLIVQSKEDRIWIIFQNFL